MNPLSGSGSRHLQNIIRRCGAHFSMDVSRWAVEGAEGVQAVTKIAHRHQAVMLTDYLYAHSKCVAYVVPPASDGASWSVILKRIDQDAANAT